MWCFGPWEFLTLQCVVDFSCSSRCAEESRSAILHQLTTELHGVPGVASAKRKIEASHQSWVVATLCPHRPGVRHLFAMTVLLNAWEV